MNEGRTALLLQILISLLFIVILSSCGSVATRKNFYEPISADLREGNYDAVAAGIEAAKENGKFEKKDRVVYYLDAGLAYHYARQFDSSNVRLHAAEEAAEELFTKSISRAALSMLLNDNALEYAGEDYEILYTNLISALNYISLGDFDDAFVEVKRANLKLEQLEMKYADAASEFQRAVDEDSKSPQITYEIKNTRFHNSAFARYLSMHMYASEEKMGDAQLDYELLEHAFKTQQHIYDFKLPKVAYKSDGGVILSIVALAGMSPVKEALNLRIRTDKDLNLVQVLYTDGDKAGQKYSQLAIEVGEDYYFKFSVPQLVDRPTMIDRILVIVDGHELGELQLIENVGLVARETYSAKKSLIYIRSLARAITKGLAAHKQKKKADTGGLGGWLKKAAIDVLADAIENADLRCSRLLPGYIYVGDFSLEPGIYNLTVEFLNYNGDIIAGQSYPGYEVSGNKLNMIEAYSGK